MQFETSQQQSWPRKESNGSDSDALGAHHASVSDVNSGIPLNVNGRRYSMHQAFKLWFDNKDSILSAAPAPTNAGENYKLDKPENLYHLSLHHARNGPDATTGVEKTFSEAPGTVQDQLPAQTSMPIQNEAPFNQHDRISSNARELVSPDRIMWVYLDPAGNEQGPFSGDVMQEWLSEGYLSLDLKIRRREETGFRTLSEFSESVQNYVQPFKVPLPPVANTFAPDSFPVNPGNHQNPGASHVGHNGGGFGGVNSFNQAGPNGASAQQAFGTNLYSQLLPNGGLGAANIRTPSSGSQLFDFMGNSDYSLMNQQFPAQGSFGIDSLNQNLTGNFGQLNMPSLLQHQIQSQQPSLARTNSGWGVDSSIQPSLPASPSVIAPAPLGGVNTSIGSHHQSGTMSPWLNRVQSMSRVSSPFVPSSSLTGEATLKTEDNVLQDYHNTIVSDILGNKNASMPENPPSNAPHTLATESSIMPEPVQKLEPNPVFDQSQTAAPEEQPSPKKEVQSTPPPVPTKAEEEVDVKVEEKEEVQPKPTEETSNITETETPNELPKPSREAEPEASQTSVAPWANPKTATKKEQPTMTLKQIQELEAARLQRLKQIKAETKQEIALANAIAASKLEDKPQDKATFNWAKSPQTVNAKKTLAEIQKEEEAELLKSKAAKSASAAPKATLAATLASITPSTEDDGAWTTVPTKKPPVAKRPTQVQPSLSYSAMSGAIDPQALRGASAQSNNTPGVSASALKEEVLIWARSSMTNLYPSVSKDDLLEIFTTLPLHPESSQLIAETIYSSSTTMDGRRFAQEFMKKRQQVENKIGSSESWSAAIASSADKVQLVDDDGWSTSSKSKKKGRRN